MSQVKAQVMHPESAIFDPESPRKRRVGVRPIKDHHETFHIVNFLKLKLR